MKQIIVGIVLILFGFVVGGVGIASAGVGIGISSFAIILVGFYLITRSLYSKNGDKKTVEGKKSVDDHNNVDNVTAGYCKQKSLESSPWGKIFLAIVLYVIGIPISLQAPVIGIPLVAVATILIFIVINRFRPGK